MATLTNEKIKLTYAGLIKTNDSGAIGAVAKPLSDGLGNAINMEVLTGQINFPSGVVDFTGSTVNGLPIQPPGLVAGTGTDSMKSADSLTTTAANASGTKSVAIGSDAQATGGLGATAVGDHARATGQFAAAFGRETIASDTGAVALGNDANATQSNTIAIGYSARGTGSAAVAIGLNANASASQAVALGAGVTAATANTVSVKALETQTASTPTTGGIIMKDAGSVARRINIDAAGVLQVDSTPVVQAFTLTRYTGTQADFACDTIQASVLIPAGTIQAGDIWELRGMESATDSTGWIYTAFWISSTGTIGTGGTESINLGQVQSPDAAWTAGYNKAIYVHTADGTGAGTTTWRPIDVSDVASSTYVAGGDPHETWAVDWTVDQYLVSRICIDNAGATYTMHGATIHKLG